MSELTAAKSRVLIADDDPTIVLLIEHVLEGLGRSFDTADNGAEAWDAWNRAHHGIVVLDIEMPELDGLEVCRRIRAAEPSRQTYIIVVTGRDRAADLEAVLDAGADDYVTKPTTGPRLLARMRIAQRRMADDQIRRVAEDELRKSRWLAGIGETMIALQHEINNPLAGILATAELMKIEAEDRRQSTAELTVIIEQARRIGDLVKRMGEMRDPKAVPYVGDATMIDLKKKS
jgi:DNA-binding response OmpR family regulator